MFNLTKCQGEPTPWYCYQLQQEVMEQLSDIPHPMYGVSGWLGIILTAASFREIMNGNEWEEPKLPNKPTPSFFFFGDNSNAQWDAYQQELNTFMQYRKIVDELRTQLIAAIDEEYLADILLPVSQSDIGIRALLPKDILKYVRRTYCTMAYDKLESNRSRLREVADPTQPIAKMFLKVSDICNTARFAGPEHVIAEASKVALVQESLLNTGSYDRMITTWNDKALSERTGKGVWDRFVTHCKDQEELRLQSLTARTEGSGNEATTMGQIKRTTSSGMRYAGTKRHKRHHAVGGPPPRAGDGRNVINGRAVGYCWSHGLSYDISHTSQTCRNPRPGHQTSACLGNTMGGSSRLHSHIMKATTKQAKGQGEPALG